MTSVNVIFEGKNEILKFVDTGKDIMEYITGRSYECPIIRSSIILDNPLGEGVFGVVFKMNVDGNTTDYVAKRVKESIFGIKTINWNQIKRKYRDKKECKTTSEYIRDNVPTVLEKDLALELNDMTRSDRDIRIPIIKKQCYKKKKVTYEKYYFVNFNEYGHSDEIIIIYEKEKVSYSKGSFICDKELIPEYIIGLLCSDLSERGICRNFMRMFGIGICGDYEGIKDFIFMERVDGTLEELEGKISEEVIDSIYCQILFAITAMNKIANVYHHDMHFGNIFYKKIPFDHSSYFEYNLNGKIYYVKNYGYHVIVGDYGNAAYYDLVNNRIITKDRAHGSMFPLWQMDEYDIMVYAMNAAYHFGTVSRMTLKILYRIFSPEERKSDTPSYDAITALSQDKDHGLKWYIKNKGRPTLLRHPIRCWDILDDETLINHDVMTRKKPKGATFIQMGNMTTKTILPLEKFDHCINKNIIECISRARGCKNKAASVIRKSIIDVIIQYSLRNVSSEDTLDVLLS